MQELIIYLLKASGLLVAFFLAYHLLLRKETFFISNRWFLLFGLIASALLPLLFFKKIVYVERPKISIEDLIAMSNNPKVLPINTITPTIETIDWLQVFVFGYGIVALLLLVRVIVNIYSISRLLKNKVVQKENNFSLIDLKEDIAPFSFFNFIVFNSSLYSPNELDSILLHEKVHSRQKHSLDVLVVHLFTIVFWINPIVWLYKKAVIQNLEFIADSKAILHIEDKKAYQKALLKVVSHQNCLPITNHFYQSLIKKRIVMLNKNQSHKRSSWKYAVVIPALIAFVFLFQIKVVAQEKVSIPTNKVAEAIPVGWVTDKNATEKEMKEDSKSLKEIYNIDYKFSNVKRNNNGEIIAIKIAFNDNNGSKGEVEFTDNNPIKPIYFSVKKDKSGKGEIGFYDYGSKFKDNSSDELKTITKIIKNDTVVWINGKVNEKEFSTNSKQDESFKESIPENSVIFIDSKKSTKKELEDLKSDEIETMYVNKENNNSTIRIITKKGLKAIDDDTEIILNDKVISKKEMDNIDNSTIETVSVTNNNGKKKIIKIVSKENLNINDSKNDIEQSILDSEQAIKDANQATLDSEQARKDAIQARKDAIQARKDAVQARKDAEQAKLDLKNKK